MAIKINKNLCILGGALLFLLIIGSVIFFTTKKNNMIDVQKPHERQLMQEMPPQQQMQEMPPQQEDNLRYEMPPQSYLTKGHVRPQGPPDEMQRPVSMQSQFGQTSQQPQSMGPSSMGSQGGQSSMMAQYGGYDPRTDGFGMGQGLGNNNPQYEYL